MLDRYDQNLLLDYLEGELDADHRAQLDAMLTDDPQLAALLNQMAADRTALRSIPQAQAPADLVHDVTSTLERRMLLDEPIDETGPIPMTLSRDFAAQPPRSISWGRVVGLTGLAASVALAAGIVVITLDDPLERTANELATTPQPEVGQANPLDDTASTPASASRSIPGQASQADGFSETDNPGNFDHGNNSNLLTEKLLADLDTPIRRELAFKSDERPTPLASNTSPDTDLAGVPDQHQPNTTPALGLTEEAADLAPSRRLARESTDGPNALPFRQQLVLFTNAPDVSREQLFDLCVTNGIPIVQSDAQDSIETHDHQAGKDAGIAQTLAYDPTYELQGRVDLPAADYALLINEHQLETLVQGLNNDVTIVRNRAGRGPLISNQAAILTPIAEDTAQHDESQAHASLASDPGFDQAHDKAKNKPGEPAPQQAFALQLPEDLGSDYANRRNAYNFQQTQPQAGYADYTIPAESDPGHTPTPPTPQVTKEDAPSTPELRKRAQQADTPKAQRADRPHLRSKTTVDDIATRERETQTFDSKRKETTSGNIVFESLPAPLGLTHAHWLYDHRQTISTPPPFLHWRRTTLTKTPTELIPVLIQQAEVDTVNTLRKQQQVEWARSTNQTNAVQVGETLKAAEHSKHSEQDKPKPTAKPSDSTPTPAAEPTPPADQTTE